MNYYDFYESPHGQMLLVANEEGVSGVYFDGQKYFPQVASQWRRDAQQATLCQTKRELAEYFAGQRKRFEVALAPEGTPFHARCGKRSPASASARPSAMANLRAGQAARAARAPQARRPDATRSGSLFPATASSARTAVSPDTPAASTESVRYSRSSRGLRNCFRPFSVPPAETPSSLRFFQPRATDPDVTWTIWFLDQCAACVKVENRLI